MNEACFARLCMEVSWRFLADGPSMTPVKNTEEVNRVPNTMASTIKTSIIKVANLLAYTLISNVERSIWALVATGQLVAQTTISPADVALKVMTVEKSWEACRFIRSEPAALNVAGSVAPTTVTSTLVCCTRSLPPEAL